jgi:hypothetical protein
MFWAFGVEASFKSRLQCPHRQNDRPPQLASDWKLPAGAASSSDQSSLFLDAAKGFVANLAFRAQAVQRFALGSESRGHLCRRTKDAVQE